MDDSKIIIGLIGSIGSGKTIVADYLVKKYDAGILRFSNVLRDLLDRLHIDNTRENLQILGSCLRSSFDNDGILADVLGKDIIEAKEKIIVVDGIRYESEFNMVKDLKGQITYIHVTPEIRYQRVVNRGTRGEKGLSYEDFLKNEDKATEHYILELGEKADHIIDNNGTYDELNKQIKQLFDGMI